MDVSGGELRFLFATMGTGKSTLALQHRFQFVQRGLGVVLVTCGDREGAQVSSRTGLSAPAVVLAPGVSLVSTVTDELPLESLDRLVVDEAQFLSAAQVDELVELVDDAGVHVYAFGLLTDFRGVLFEGSKRLLEVADRRVESPLEAVCWCGRRASQNARVVNDRVVRDGAVVQLGDTDAASPVRYELLCRPHFRAGALGAPTP